MGLNCRFSYSSAGILEVRDSQGNIPALYSEALTLFNNQEKALRAWALTYTPSFKQQVGDGPYSIDDVIKYQNNQLEAVPMSTEELYSIKRLLKVQGYTSLSDLSDTLTSIFKPEGVFTVNSGRAISSGLYTQEEINQIEPQEIVNTLSLIESQLLVEDLTVEPDSAPYDFKDSSYKTMIGTFERVSNQQIERSVQEKLSSLEDLDRVIAESPYTEFSDRYFNSPTFQAQIRNRFNSLKLTPILRLEGEELRDTTPEIFETTKNTIQQDYFEEVLNGLEADLRILESIDEVIWKSSLPEVTKILRNIEKDLAEQGVDVVGVSKIALQRDQVLDVLSSASNLMNNFNLDNLTTFSNFYSVAFPPNPNIEFNEVDEVYKDLNIVRVNSYLSDNTLFERYGLIKILDGLYHKVQRGQITELYDYLYRQVQMNELILPTPVEDIENKPNTIAKIAEYVMTKDTGFDNNFQEEISLNQLAFGHLPIQRATDSSQDVAILQEIQTDEQYLKTDFVSEFYTYQLEEKIAESDIYRNTLSAFTITDADITLNWKVDGIEDLKYTQELKDYFKLKRDSRSKYLYENDNTDVNEDLYYVNNPHLIPENQQQVLVEIDDYIVTTPNSQPFLKKGNDIYKKTLSKDNSDLYLKIGLSADPVYYTNNTNFDFDAKAVSEFYESVNLDIPNPSFSSQITQSILDSNLELLNLYPESEEINTEDCA